MPRKTVHKRDAEQAVKKTTKVTYCPHVTLGIPSASKHAFKSQMTTNVSGLPQPEEFVSANNLAFAKVVLIMTDKVEVSSESIRCGLQNETDTKASS